MSNSALSRKVKNQISQALWRGRSYNGTSSGYTQFSYITVASAGCNFVWVSTKYIYCSIFDYTDENRMLTAHAPIILTA